MMGAEFRVSCGSKATPVRPYMRPANLSQVLEASSGGFLRESLRLGTERPVEVGSHRERSHIWKSD
jgi:hypothetical protein